MHAHGCVWPLLLTRTWVTWEEGSAPLTPSASPASSKTSSATQPHAPVPGARASAGFGDTLVPEGDPRAPATSVPGPQSSLPSSHRPRPRVTASCEQRDIPVSRVGRVCLGLRPCHWDILQEPRQATGGSGPWHQVAHLLFLRSDRGKPSPRGAQDTQAPNLSRMRP